MRDVRVFDGVLMHRSPVDMRRGIDGLRALATDASCESTAKRMVFAFVSRSRDKVKLLYWDRTGYALWYKRLERARFPWPRGDDETLDVSGELFTYLLDGVDIFVRPHADFALTSAPTSATPLRHDRSGSSPYGESRVTR